MDALAVSFFYCMIKPCRTTLVKSQGDVDYILVRMLISLMNPNKQKKVKKYNLFFKREIVLFEVTIS